MNPNPITKINGTDIVTVEKDGETYLPVTPICNAIGIDAKAQRDKIQNDEFLCPTGVIITSVGADGKDREMFCMPLKFIYGWLATINPGKVSQEARDAVMRYRRECYEVLYDHFAGAARKAAERSRLEADLLRERGQLLEQSRVIKTEIREIDEKLTALAKERTDPQPSLF
mgnify:CR=1 FL=1